MRFLVTVGTLELCTDAIIMQSVKCFRIDYHLNLEAIITRPVLL